MPCSWPVYVSSHVMCFFSCRLRCNLAKNRYKDVVCYDETRVVLKTSSGVEGSDYIHANYVSGYSKPQAFVLTQGVLVWFMDWALYNSHIYCIGVFYQLLCLCGFLRSKGQDSS